MESLKNLTDYIVIAALLLFAYTGSRQGFLKTIFGPVSIVLGTILCTLYYNMTRHFLYSLAIATFSPLLIQFLFRLSLKFWNKLTKQDADISTKSKVLGALCNLFWSGSLLALMLILIAVVPHSLKWFAPVQEDVLKSKTYYFLNFLTGNRLPKGAEQIQKTLFVFQDKEKLTRLQSQPEFQKLMEDDKIQSLLSDAKTLKQIQEKDLTGLLSNPRVGEILADKETLEKLYKINKLLLKQTSAEEE